MIIHETLRVTDDEGYVIAGIERRTYEPEMLDYVSITSGDKVICIPLAQVPEFLRAVMRAASKSEG